jgi:hypothetical protein
LHQPDLRREEAPVPDESLHGPYRDKIRSFPRNRSLNR